MLQEKIELLLSKISELPDSLFSKTDGGTYEVLWLLNRQKPSVEVEFDFNEERFGVTKDGKIIWGFDSGCSCPSPWSSEDFGDNNYDVRLWKEFQIEKFPKFDVGYENEIIKNIDKILG